MMIPKLEMNLCVNFEDDSQDLRYINDKSINLINVHVSLKFRKWHPNHHF